MNLGNPAGEAEIIVEGGICRVSDLPRGLTFGASTVGMSRPILNALALGRENGITDLIAGITRELARRMCMVGSSSP